MQQHHQVFEDAELQFRREHQVLKDFYKRISADQPGASVKDIHISRNLWKALPNKGLKELLFNHDKRLVQYFFVNT